MFSIKGDEMTWKGENAYFYQRSTLKLVNVTKEQHQIFKISEMLSERHQNTIQVDKPMNKMKIN